MDPVLELEGEDPLQVPLGVESVSYTHLDVYKRQEKYRVIPEKQSGIRISGF